VCVCVSVVVVVVSAFAAVFVCYCILLTEILSVLAENMGRNSTFSSEKELS